MSFLYRLTIVLFVVLTFSSTFANEERIYSFSSSAQGWQGDFTDYPEAQEFFYDLSWGWENVPQKNLKGVYLSGNNHSDDLFMYVRKPVQELKPNTIYAAYFSVNIETNAPAQSMGIGGSPGESLFFKVGASTTEPLKQSINGDYFLSVDKGNQSQGGENAVVIGNLAHPEVDMHDPQYHSKILASDEPVYFMTDEAGNGWIFLGTDSGFEGPTKFYITSLRVVFQEQ